MSKASFGLYVIHQQWIVITAYFALMWFGSVPMQLISVLLASVVLTLLTYEAFRRFRATRLLFGLKK